MKTAPASASVPVVSSSRRLRRTVFARASRTATERTPKPPTIVVTRPWAAPWRAIADRLHHADLRRLLRDERRDDVYDEERAHEQTDDREHRQQEHHRAHRVLGPEGARLRDDRLRDRDAVLREHAPCVRGCDF